MKEMSKVKIFQKKSISSIIDEMILLSNLKHPLISNLYYAYQDNENLYLIMDYLSGGDLRYHLINKHKFNEESIKFIISNIILILEYLNDNNIIHRDLKLENLIFDNKGYINLIDFGIAIENNPSYEIKKIKGTPFYIAPELINKNSFDFSIDYFALGVITYELIFNKKPFISKNKKEIIYQILYKDINLNENDLPIEFKGNFLICDFINKLLKKIPYSRLGGLNGINEIKKHPWLCECKWDKILNKEIVSPCLNYINGENCNYYKNKKNDNFKCDNYNDILEKINNDKIFKDFFYNYFEHNYQFSNENLNITKSCKKKM